MAKEINLKELFAVIKKRFWIVAVVTVLFTLVAESFIVLFLLISYINLHQELSSRQVLKIGRLFRLL